MKRILAILVISAGIIGYSMPTQAQKIGYISADEIIMLMPEAAEVQQQLDQYQKDLYKNAEDKQTAFNEALNNFIKDSATMSPSLKEIKRKDLAQRNQELSQEAQSIQNQLYQKRQELSLPIQQKLQTAIEAVAKANGYTYVLPREALIVAPPGDDLGPLVMKKLGLKEPAPAPTTDSTTTQ